MINIFEVNETNKMIEHENLDVRTITMGISLLDCVDSDLKKLNENIYNKITNCAKNLVETGEKISMEYGIPIVNKRISVTPIALLGGAACHSSEDFVSIANTRSSVGERSGREFYRRIFRSCKQGNDSCGRTSDPFHSPGACGDGESLQLCKRRIHQDRYQHGCCETDGRDRS